MRIFRKFILVLALALTIINLVPQVNYAEEEDIPGTLSITDS